MIRLNELRKEKVKLKEYIQTCTKNIEILINRKEEFDKLYSLSEISEEDYQKQVKYGIEGKSFDHWINYNKELLELYYSKLADIERKTNESANGTLTISLGIMIVLFLITFIYNNPSITSNVIFGENTILSQNISLTFNKSGNYSLTIPEGTLNLISFNCEFEGKYAKIYVESDEEKKLFGVFETNTNLSRYCGGICDTIFDKSITLIIELEENSSFKLNKIYYQRTLIKEFNIEPKKQEFNKPGYGIITLFNERNDSFTVVAYAEGKLADYITLDDSILEFSEKDKQKMISYRVEEAPYSMTGNIVIRYLPKEPFKGITPTETHIVTYKKEDKLNITNVLGILLLLNLLLLIITRLKYKKIKNKINILAKHKSY